MHLRQVGETPGVALNRAAAPSCSGVICVLYIVASLFAVDMGMGYC